MKLTKLIWIFLLVLPIVYAGGYMEYASIGWVKSNFCSIFGCTMQGDLDMGGYDILNATMVNVNRTNSTEVCINGVCIDSWLWNRTGTTLIPANDGDIINTTGTGSSFGGLTDSSIADTQVVYSNSNRLTGDAGLTFASGTGTLSATEFVGGGAGLTGLASYWDRVGTVLSPSTAGDDITTTGTITAGADATVGIDLTPAGAGADIDSALILSAKRGATTAFAGGMGSGFLKNNAQEFFNLWGGGSTTIFGGGVTNDAYRRFRIKTTGEMLWGDGTTATDTTLYRDAANRLRLENALFIRGNDNQERFVLHAGTSQTQNMVDISDSGGTDYITVDKDGNLNIIRDDLKLTLGAAGATDSYIQFGGTNLEYYSSGIHDFLAGDITTTGTGSSFGGLTDTSIADTQVVYSN